MKCFSNLTDQFCKFKIAIITKELDEFLVPLITLISRHSTNSNNGDLCMAK